MPTANLRILLEHVEKETPILCGCEQAGDYFVYDSKADPVILSCYRNVSVLGACVTYHDLHKDVKTLYDIVSEQVPHSGYANALQEVTQHEIRAIVRHVIKSKCLLL